MLSEHVARADRGYAGLVMSAAEYLALGEREQRYELVNGVVVMSPGRRPRHWRFVEEVLDQLKAFAKPRGGFETYADTDLCIDGVTVLRPDLCVYARPRARRAPERLDQPPDLVVEINSPGNKAYDLETKRRTYERFGVREYWSIDPWDPAEPPGMRVRAWWLQGGKFEDFARERDGLASRAIGGFVLDLRPLREIAGE
ncbi:MAG TPA: Uma2 family endonuclease [Phycisphaerales bacterium]|nr:Uma2 family endonuclease [Phycisphaerales bacterium]